LRRMLMRGKKSSKKKARLLRGEQSLRLLEKGKKKTRKTVRKSRIFGISGERWHVEKKICRG